VSLQAATAASLRAIARSGRAIIARTTNSDADKRHAKNRLSSGIGETLQKKVIARIIVQAIDQESAQRIATEQVRATLDVILFVGALLRPRALIQVPSIDDGAERSQDPVLVLRQGKSVVGPPMTHEGKPIEVDDLFKPPAVKGLFVRLLSNLLKKGTLTESEERVLAAARWAGRAIGQARPTEEFLFHLIALETLLLPKEKEPELTYRLRLRAAHLLSRSLRGRQDVFQRIGRLYATRSKIVHTGSTDVSAEELPSARRLTQTALLIVLNRMGRKPELEEWLTNQVLK
jgi:hypothetical protein